MRFCRRFICAAYQAAISPPCYLRFWEQMRPICHPRVLSRLKSEWAEEFERWQKRNLTVRRYVYFWADGIYLQARAEDHKECILVIIGATPEGRKELVGFQAGVRKARKAGANF